MNESDRKGRPHLVCQDVQILIWLGYRRKTKEKKRSWNRKYADSVKDYGVQQGYLWLMFTQAIKTLTWSPAKANKLHTKVSPFVCGSIQSLARTVDLSDVFLEEISILLNYLWSLLCTVYPVIGKRIGRGKYGNFWKVIGNINLKFKTTTFRVNQWCWVMSKERNFSLATWLVFVEAMVNHGTVVVMSICCADGGLEVLLLSS